MKAYEAKIKRVDNGYIISHHLVDRERSDFSSHVNVFNTIDEAFVFLRQLFEIDTKVILKAVSKMKCDSCKCVLEGSEEGGGALTDGIEDLAAIFCSEECQQRLMKNNKKLKLNFYFHEELSSTPTIA